VAPIHRSGISAADCDEPPLKLLRQSGFIAWSLALALTISIGVIASLNPLFQHQPFEWHRFVGFQKEVASRFRLHDSQHEWRLVMSGRKLKPVIDASHNDRRKRRRPAFALPRFVPIADESVDFLPAYRNALSQSKRLLVRKQGVTRAVRASRILPYWIAKSLLFGDEIADFAFGESDKIYPSGSGGRVAYVFEHKLKSNVCAVDVVGERLYECNSLGVNPRAFRQFKFLLRSYGLSSRRVSLPLYLGGGLLALFERRAKYEKCGGSSSNPKESEDIEIPLLPKCPSPKFLFALAVVTFGSLWLSDFRLTTMKHSEPVADLIWFVGWMGDAICGAALLLSLANRHL